MPVEYLIEQYSLTGNDRLLKKSWEILEDELTKEITQSALINAAWLAQANHDFDQADTYVNQVLEMAPSNQQAWLLKAAIAQVQGETVQAQKACSKLSIRASITIGMFCSARILENRKQQATTLKQLTKLLPLSSNHKINAWGLTTIADLAIKTGKSDLARNYYLQAFNLYSTVQTRAALADIYIRESEFNKALNILGESHAPALSVRRMHAQHELQIVNHQEIKSMNKVFEKWIAAKDFRHAREMVMFYLDVMPNTQRAYELAQKNIVLQQEPEDKHLLARARQNIEEKHF